MASPSSFTSQNYNFNVFVSSHGPDVPKTLLSHLREQFKRNGIPMFDDQEIERSATISPSLIEAIRNSRISIVILSKKYASSSWCLNELVEILKCKRTMGQIVMPIFYDMDPSDVRKQTGDFGIGFNETCKGKMEHKRQKWSQALIEVGNIAGEEFFQWDNESKMIEKIANNVLNKISATPSWDFKYCYGVQNWTDKIEMSPEFESNIAFENKYDAGYLSDGLIYKSKERKNVEANERTDCLSFLLLCLDLSHLIIDVASRLIG